MAMASGLSRTQIACLMVPSAMTSIFIMQELGSTIFRALRSLAIQHSFPSFGEYFCEFFIKALPALTTCCALRTPSQFSPTGMSQVLSLLMKVKKKSFSKQAVLLVAFFRLWTSRKKTYINSSTKEKDNTDPLHNL